MKNKYRDNEHTRSALEKIETKREKDMIRLLLLVALFSSFTLHGQRMRIDTAPKAGSLAPDFTLKTMDNKTTIKLSSFRKKKPVVLVFGSIT